MREAAPVFRMAGLGCGAGTVAIGDECFPDGSVICAGGTSFDEKSGLCVPDLRECREGTVQVGDECVTLDDTLMADSEEGAEPNDWRQAGSAVPFLSLAEAAATTLKGCFEPVDHDHDGVPDPDLDSWFVRVAEPTILNVRTDGVGGASAASVLRSVEGNLHRQMGYRFGIDLTSDGSERTMFLPKAGTYVLSIVDSRSLDLLGPDPLDGLPAGDGTSCYFAEVGIVEMPAAAALREEPMSSDFGALRVFNLADTPDAVIRRVSISSASALARPSLVFARGGEFVKRRTGRRLRRILVPGRQQRSLGIRRSRIRCFPSGRALSDSGPRPRLQPHAPRWLNHHARSPRQWTRVRLL